MVAVGDVGWWWWWLRMIGGCRLISQACQRELPEGPASGESTTMTETESALLGPQTPDRAR